MIKIENLEVELKDFNLLIDQIYLEEGNIYAILGPSGSGKSSLIEAILGFRRLKRGKISLFDKDITNLETFKRNFGYLPQNLALFPHMKVKDNILYPLRAKKENINNKKELFNKLIQESKLEKLLDRYPINLSGGEKQRVALIRAIIATPKLLLLDEPFSALDEGLKRELQFNLKEMLKRYKITTLFITHDINEALFLADKLYILINGKVIQEGDYKDILDKPASIEVAKYLGYQNIFRAQIVKKESNFTKIFIYALNKELYINSNNIKKDIKEFFVLIKERDILFEKRNINSFDGEINIYPQKDESLIFFQIKGSKKPIKAISSNHLYSKNIFIDPNKIIPIY